MFALSEILLKYCREIGMLTNNVGVFAARLSHIDIARCAVQVQPPTDRRGADTEVQWRFICQNGALVEHPPRICFISDQLSGSVRYRRLSQKNNSLWPGNY